MSQFEVEPTFWSRFGAVAIVGALVLAGCGSDDGDDKAAESSETTTTVPVDKNDDIKEEPRKNSGSNKPVVYLPFDGTAPAGYKMVPAECAATKDELADAREAGDIEYPSPLTFAVPQGWDHSGKSSGGAGGMTSTDSTFKFRTVESGSISIGFEWDDRGPDGELYADGKRSESFDYEHDLNGTSKLIKHEKVSTVSVDDQRVDIFYRDPSQAPERFDDEQYKVRISAFDIPESLMASDGVDVYSFVFTISFDKETSELDQAMVEAIVETVSLPTCTWDDLLIFEEVIRQADLNGDGKVKTMQEWQAELQQGLKDKAAAAGK